jgi:hypothetical protein
MIAQKGANKTTREIDDKNSTQKQFISSQAFHRTPGGRVREPTAGERFRPRNLKTLDPTTQGYNWASPAIIHTQEYTRIEA